MWKPIRCHHHQAETGTKRQVDCLPSALFFQSLLKLFTGLIVAGGLLWIFTLSAADNQQQLKNIQQGIAEKQETVKRHIEQRRQLQLQLRQQDENIAQASKALRTTQATLDNLKKQITALNLSIKKLQSRQATQQILLSKQLDHAFRQGGNSALTLIFSTEEGNRRNRILAYFSYFNQARQKTINQIEHTKTELAIEKTLLQQKQQQQQQTLNQQTDAQTKLETARKARQGILKSLEISLQEDQQKLAELQQNEQRLRNKIANAEREARARTEQEAREAAKLQQKQQQMRQSGSTYTPTAAERALMARTGGLGAATNQHVWPVRGRVLHRFGESQQGELRWKGMVIVAAEGREVKTIADGRVLLADWLQGYGLVVVIGHGKGDMSLYGYNQSALVSVGEQVQAGRPIALVGNSGGQQQPSLYFEIRRQGKAVNPQPWLGK